MNFGVQVNEYKDKRIGLYGGKFLPFHMGHLNCILQAQSKVDILFVVIGYDDDYDKSLCEGKNFEWVSSRVRERWITEELRAFKNIRVLSQYERRSDDYMNDETIADSYKELLHNIGGKVDMVFSSEPEYESYFEKYLPMAKHHIVDPARSRFNISATKVREDGIFPSWEFLPKSVQRYYVKRVAVCGIESAGKTHLTKMLSVQLRTELVKEYGRLYYENINGFNDISEPTDYEEIAVGHCHNMNMQAKEANKVLIVDTDLCYTQFFYVMENKCYNPAIDMLIKSNAEKIDVYIYIEPHNPHELDGTRRPVTDLEREQRNNMLKEIYQSYGIHLIIVDEPDRHLRYEKCLSVIEGLIN